MANNYTVRVELHKADDDDYEELHAAMEEKGFVRWVLDTKENVKYRLPTAEYNITGTSLDRYQIRDKAIAAAKSVKASPTPWILVTQSAGRTWDGLKKWQE